MAIKAVLKMGNPLLRKKSEDVTLDEIKSGQVEKWLEDMQDTMESEKGIGIAAPQIGVSKRLAIIGIMNEGFDEPTLITVINPVIEVLDNNKQGNWEGCLSVPGLRGYVERPSEIRVTYLDLNGDEAKLEADGFHATIFQHEIDHLDGILYIDKVEDNTKLTFVEEFQEYILPNQFK